MPDFDKSSSLKLPLNMTELKKKVSPFAVTHNLRLLADKQKFLSGEVSDCLAHIACLFLHACNFRLKYSQFLVLTNLETMSHQ